VEFSIRIIFFPRLNSVSVMYAGLTIVIVAQTIRTVAISTCGESFNHLIQTAKKDNHVLITHGM
jgi:protein-S-isoprenylcysteine O-methyltransferase